MNTPIFIYDSGDLLIFESVELAEQYIEPYDLSSYIGYDSNGCVLHLCFIKNQVKILRKPTDPVCPEVLRNILITFMAKVGVDSELLSGSTLTKLVAKSLQYKIG